MKTLQQKGQELMDSTRALLEWIVAYCKEQGENGNTLTEIKNDYIRLFQNAVDIATNSELVKKHFINYYKTMKTRKIDGRMLYDLNIRHFPGLPEYSLTTEIYNCINNFIHLGDDDIWNVNRFKSIIKAKELEPYFYNMYDYYNKLHEKRYDFEFMPGEVMFDKFENALNIAVNIVLCTDIDYRMEFFEYHFDGVSAMENNITEKDVISEVITEEIVMKIIYRQIKTDVERLEFDEKIAELKQEIQDIETGRIDMDDKEAEEYIIQQQAKIKQLENESLPF